MATDEFNTQVCIKCNVLKPLADFSVRRASKSGRNAICKGCCHVLCKTLYHRDPEKHRARRRDAYARFKEKDNASSRAYKISHAEEIKTQMASYREEHRDKRNAAARARYDKNREKMIAKAVEWQAANPEKVFLSVRKNNVVRKSRLRAAEGKMTRKEWDAILTYYNHCCAYCLRHESEAGTLELDHMVPVVRGGSAWPENCAPACRNCNASKSHHTPMEFLSRQCDRLPQLLVA